MNRGYSRRTRESTGACGQTSGAQTRTYTSNLKRNSLLSESDRSEFSLQIRITCFVQVLGGWSGGLRGRCWGSGNSSRSSTQPALPLPLARSLSRPPPRPSGRWPERPRARSLARSPARSLARPAARLGSSAGTMLYGFGLHGSVRSEMSVSFFKILNA